MQLITFRMQDRKEAKESLSCSVLSDCDNFMARAIFFEIFKDSPSFIAMIRPFRFQKKERFKEFGAVIMRILKDRNPLLISRMNTAACGSDPRSV